MGDRIGTTPRSLQGAVGHARDRRLRVRQRRARADAPLHRRRHRAGTGDAVADRRQPDAERRRAAGRRPAAAVAEPLGACRPPRPRLRSARRGAVDAASAAPSLATCRHAASLAKPLAPRRRTPRPPLSGTLGVATPGDVDGPDPLSRRQVHAGHATGTTVNLRARARDDAARCAATRPRRGRSEIRAILPFNLRPLDEPLAARPGQPVRAGVPVAGRHRRRGRAPRRGAPPDGRDQALAGGADVLRHPRRRDGGAGRAVLGGVHAERP